MSYKFEVVKPPKSIPMHKESFKIFLAGSIEMGKAIDWQTDLTTLLDAMSFDKDVVIINPRRDDWDSSWKQDVENPQFYQQVNWELTGLECADLVVMHFAANTMSPISLLEFGMYMNKMIVYADNEYQRKGNVDIVCQRYKIPQASSLSEVVDFIENLTNK